tara:strand:- start:86 stop:430 length:345 start_codon:yes stop_codon:yes gene_type:complete
MPSSRKRIGFLPSSEVQSIINEICLKNNLSQSKVTGILVEEALSARKLYQIRGKINSKEIHSESLDFSTKDFNKNSSNTKKNNDISIDNEYKLVKEYLNYKNFKAILSIIKSEK